MTKQEIEELILAKVSEKAAEVRKSWIKVASVLLGIIILQVGAFVYDRGTMNATVKRNTEDIKEYTKSTAEYNASVNTAISQLTEVAIRNQEKTEANEKALDRHIDRDH